MDQIDSSVTDDKESLINESNYVEEQELNDRPSSLTLPAVPSDVNYFFTRSPKMSFRNHFIATVILLILVTVAAVLLPAYLDALNVKTDVYCGLFFTSLTSLVWTSILVISAKFRFRDCNLRCPISLKKALKLGIYLGVGGICVFYSRDRNRVLCHLQDPLAAALLPMAVVGHFLFSPKIDSTRKLFCLAATIIGLFICIDFQIWDEFTCHGHSNKDFSSDKKNWTTDENAVWTIVYLAGLADLALFLILLDKEMKGDRPECLIATIALTPTSSANSPYHEAGHKDLCESLLQNQDFDTESQTSLIPYISKDRLEELFHTSQILVLGLWIQAFSFLTIVALGWTDLFSFLGKAGSAATLEKHLQSVFLCQFYPSEDCGSMTTVGWLFIISCPALILSILFFINYSGTCSAPYLTSLLTAALPLSAFCWSLFKTEDGFQWSPMFTGETGFTLVGFPIMVVALSLYCYYANKESRHYNKSRIDRD